MKAKCCWMAGDVASSGTRTGVSDPNSLLRERVGTENGFEYRVDPALGGADTSVVHKGLVVAGHVRLDGAPNCHAVQDLTPEGQLRTAADLYLENPQQLRLMTGAFALAIIDVQRQRLFAIRDQLGLAPLFYRPDFRKIAVSHSPVDLAEDCQQINLSFIADFIATLGWPSSASMFANVLEVPPGSVLEADGKTHTVDEYWSASRFAPLATANFEDCLHEFRSLVDKGVAASLDPAGKTWATLSGGLDSSTVVSAAEASATADRRLGGTVTLVDSLGGGDDERLSKTVVEKFSLVNEQFRDYWPWQSDGEAPPYSDHPSRDYPFYARERAIGRLLRSRGATSLLSGVGPDHYMPATSAHIPDLLWGLRLTSYAREIYKWTMVTRDSLWRTIPEHSLCLLHAAPVRRGRRSRNATPAWLTPAFVVACSLKERLAHQPMFMGRRGNFYASGVHWALRRIGRLFTWLPGVSAEGISIRHPLLYLPLVEFVLRLPVSFRTGGYRSKPILRRAMHGILPEAVRTRTTKGGLMEPRFCWAFSRESRAIEEFLAKSQLAALGCIDPVRMRKAIEAARSGKSDDAALLYVTLSLDCWLRNNSGRWTSRARQVQEECHGIRTHSDRVLAR